MPPCVIPPPPPCNAWVGLFLGDRLPRISSDTSPDRRYLPYPSSRNTPVIFPVLSLRGSRTKKRAYPQVLRSPTTTRGCGFKGPLRGSRSLWGSPYHIMIMYVCQVPCQAGSARDLAGWLPACCWQRPSSSAPDLPDASLNLIPPLSCVGSPYLFLPAAKYLFFSS